GPVTLDWDTIVRRQHAIVRELQPPAAAFEKLGAKIYRGEARFVNDHAVQANGHGIEGTKIVVAAGSEPVVPPLPGRELAITSDDVLFLPHFPESLVLVGGGVIGLEMAGAFGDLGARVTVVARETEILPTLDTDVAAYIRKVLEGRGVTFHLGATLERLSGRRGAVTVHVTKTARRWRSPRSKSASRSDGATIHGASGPTRSGSKPVGSGSGWTRISGRRSPTSTRPGTRRAPRSPRPWPPTRARSRRSTRCAATSRPWITRSSRRRSSRRPRSRASGSRMPRRCAVASGATSPATTRWARRTGGRRARTGVT